MTNEANTKNRLGGTHPGLAGVRLVLLGVLINLALALAKGIAGVTGNSDALIADAIESFLDVVSSLIVIGGLLIAIRPPDEDHPYGHGKAEPLAAMAVAVGLAITSIIVMYTSVREIMGTPGRPELFTLPVIIGVIVIKEILFRRVIRANQHIQSTAVELEGYHHRTDALTSLAAFFGISVAILGGPAWYKADDYAAIFAAVVILYNAYRLTRPAVGELTDSRAGDEIESEVRGAAASVRGVRQIEKCLIRKAGFDYHVDIHVVVDGEISVRDGHEIAHRVKDKLRESNDRIYEVLAHIEPHEE